MEDSLPKFNIKITEDQIQNGARELISQIQPDWPVNKLNYKIFTDGITNRLIGVYKDRHNKQEMILIRIYGENTDLFIDRNVECRNMRIMYKHGLSAPIYGTFINGICYGFSPGIVLDEKLVRNDNISKLIAENLAQMHTLKPFISKNNNFPTEPKACLFADLKKFLSLINVGALRNKILNNQIKNLWNNITHLKLEVEFVEQCLIKEQSPIVFCHNDLLLKNIVYNEKQNKVTFIDFEYSNYNYQAFDIANHFCEFCGVDSFDPNLFPSKEFQLKWLRIYLQKWYLLKNDFNSTNIETNIQNLYKTVKKFTIAAHLYWGIWALVQACNSSIDFDYLTFAYNRLEEYFKSKNEQINLLCE